MGARAQGVGRRPQRFHVIARDANDAEQPVERRLRMAGDADRAVLARADHRPGAFVEVLVEVGQHHRALRRAGDCRDQPGGGAVGSGRAGDDRRAARGALRQGVDFGVDEQRAAPGAVDQAALVEPGRPLREGDLEEIEGDAPIGVECVGDESVEPPRIDALDDHVVDQRGQVARQRVSLGRARRHQRALAFVEHLAPVGLDAADGAAERLAPGARQSGQSHAAGEFADGGRRDVA